MIRRLFVVVLAALVVLTAGCGGKTAEKKKTASERMATAANYLDSAKSVHIDMSTPTLPKGVQGILNATGSGSDQPAFEGDIKVIQSGLSITVPTISIDGTTHIKFGTAWQTIDPATVGAPDPATLFGKGGGLSKLAMGATGLKGGKDTRQGSEILSTITGKIPGTAVKSLIPKADSGSDFDATFVLDEKDHLTSIKLTGPFYGASAGTVSYTIALTNYNVAVTIKAP